MHYSLIAGYGPPQAKRILERSQARVTDPRMHDDGWLAYDESAVSLGRISKQAARERVAGLHRIMHPANRTVIRRALVDALDRLGTPIKVYFVVAPVVPILRRELDAERWSYALRTVQDLASSRPNVSILQVSDSDFTLEDFGDLDHLNAAGAEKFSTRLGRMICPNFFPINPNPI